MELWTIILAIIAGALGVYRFFFRNVDHFRRLGIPHVKSLPILGNMGPAVFRRKPFAKVLQWAYNSHPQAKYIGFHEFSTPVIMIRDPELIKSIAIKNFDNFPDHKGFVDPDHDPLFGKNLSALEGEKWRSMRTVLSPAFTSSKMKMMFKLMSRCSVDFADFLAKQPVQSEGSNMKDAFTRYTNDVIATCAFGISVNSMEDRENQFFTMGRDVTNFEGILSLKIFMLRSFPRLSRWLNVKIVSEKHGSFFKDVIEGTIRTRESEGINRPDMIQLMMQARDRDEGRLTIEELTAQAFIFFFGGFDTSSTGMCFTAHEVAVNPEVQEKLQAEIDAVLEEGNGEVTYEALHGMKYMDAVVSESLRMYPVAPFLDRICTKSFELPASLPGLEPITVQPGSCIWFPVYGIQHDPKYFPEPEKFKPERFYEENRTNIDSSTFITFGLGPRMCIGNRFALMETKLVLFHLLARCNLKPCAKTLIPLQISSRSFTLNAKGGFWLTIEPRK